MAERHFVFADENELFSLMKDIDCLYCRNPVPASKHHLEKRHLKLAMYYKDADIGKFSIPCYCADGGHGRSHWHCPICPKILRRTQDYRNHITNHGVKMTKNKPERHFVFADENELFSLMKDIDCLYCRNPVPASKHHLEKRHLKLAMYYKDADIGKFSIPCYCADGGHGRSHWHCPICPKILRRTQDYRNHITNHGVEVTDNTPGELQPTTFLFETLQTDKDDKMPDKKLTCQTCGILFTSLSNLRRHERLQHGQFQQPMFCIDAKNGIYITTKDLHGPRVPIHVLKSFALQVMLCESKECREFMIAQGQCGNPGKECCHLERTSHAQQYVPPPALCLNSLEEMTYKGLLSKSEKQQCQEMNSRACLEGVDCVYPISWGKFELLDRYVNFSVYTNLKDTWCQFGRTHVSFDTRSGNWKCLCEHKRNGCIHKYLSMWWVFQEQPEFFPNNLETNPEREDKIEEVVVLVENDI
ncbi:uncharacterized protein si:ch211-10d23.5 isoform X3 [Xyrauchen texanus]|uniref:uncharacterized protein si:ch211-10d23.5 isoform X3 n=1 Tax=Xyrauchen texanus TaxID=154827 RepID=UPI002242AA99|nr:uncharacterized protein si:ch211-10d23.5 isoform X3 [Xyrauchen texanus]